MKVKVTQSCLTFCDPMDRSIPGFSVLGILQARILKWVAVPFSRGSSQPRSPALKVILYHLSHQGSPRILEWVAYPFSRGSSQPRGQTHVFRVAGRFFTIWATREFFITYSWPLCFKLIDQIFMGSLLGSPFLLICMSVFMLVSYSYEYYNIIKFEIREHLSFKNFGSNFLLLAFLCYFLDIIV